MTDPVQYVLVRADLPPVAQMVHVGHACGESIRVAPISKATIVRVLHVKDEAELRAYHVKLIGKGFHCALVEENSGPLAGQVVSLGVEPSIERLSALGKLFWHLRPASLESLPAPVAASREFDPGPMPHTSSFDGDCG